MTPSPDSFDRRQLLSWGSHGLAATAVAHLLGDDGAEGSQRELVLAWRPGFKRSAVIDLVLQCAQQIVDA